MGRVQQDYPVASNSNSLPLKKMKAPKQKKPAPLKPSASTPPLGKFLASSEKHIRDKAVASLSKFLSNGQVKAGEEEQALAVGDLDWSKEWPVDKRLAPLEMAKLWKGIFFCFWMSDKPLVQQALASSLAGLVLDVRPKDRKAGRVERFRAAMTYLRGFWEATVREWGGLDRLRLDKFYLLIRRFVHAAFLLLKREQWDPVAVAEYNALLVGPGGPLHVEDSRIPASLAYHLGDIYLAELERACPLTDADSPSTPKMPLNLLLQPIYTTLALAPSSTMFNRLQEHAVDPLLEYTLPPKPQPPTKRRKIAEPSSITREEYPGLVADAQEGAVLNEEAKDTKEKVGREVLRAIFEEGGKTTTNEVNRRRLYLICRKWEDAAAVEL